jgi:hypothetical protein
LRLSALKVTVASDALVSTSTTALVTLTPAVSVTRAVKDRFSTPSIRTLCSRVAVSSTVVRIVVPSSNSSFAILSVGVAEAVNITLEFSAGFNSLAVKVTVGGTGGGGGSGGFPHATIKLRPTSNKYHIFIMTSVLLEYLT